MKVRKLERVFAYDIDPDRAKSFAQAMAGMLGIKIRPVHDIAKSAQASDICVTCTTARDFFLRREHLSPGAFIAAVGADSEEKQELEPAIFVQSKVVTDILEQSATIGDLHHALKAGRVSRDDVHAELGEVVAGTKAGRKDDDELIVFDSTGMALQDVAAAVLVYQRALNAGLESRIELN
jgi:ornithine cyclodeaminase/alanine dehydrogenase-like protein (mu-crystallin family)